MRSSWLSCRPRDLLYYLTLPCAARIGIERAAHGLLLVFNQLAFGADGNRAKDEFFPMGDNSTASLDARVWPGPDRFVPRDLLIGRAIFIYWPHSQNKPIPFFPNFTKMKFIR